MFGLVKFLEVKCYCSENLNKFFWLFALCRGFLGCLVIKMGDVATNVTNIFEDLYNMNYPIYKMVLVSNYKGSDWQSIEAGNTSALNCRSITGSSKKWSKHAFGKAIDINPIENPYISRKGHISHKASLKYRKRVKRNKTAGDRAVLLKDSQATQIFEHFGWKWGGDWRSIKDYQHFEYNHKRSRSNLY